MNPLAILRKRRKVLLVIFGVLLMIAFTVGGVVTNYVGQVGVRENPVVVRWRGTELRETDMYRLRVVRNQLRAFLTACLQLTHNRGGTAGDPRLRGVMAPEMMLQSLLVDSEEGIVQTLLLAKAAEEAGIVVSDQAVLHYLSRLTDEMLQSNEFATVLAQVTGGRMSQRMLIDALRQQLMAWQMNDLARSGIFPTTPGTAWQLYRKLNRRIEAEVMPVPASQFVAEVQEPSEAEVRELFENYKDQLPMPGDPEPGFKLPLRAAFEYVKADGERFMETAKKEVSQADVEAYYHAHLEEFRRGVPADWGDIGPLDLEPEATPAPDSVPVPQEDVPQEDVPSAPRDQADVPQDELADPRDALADPRDALADPQDALADPQDALADPQDALMDPQDELADPQDEPPSDPPLDAGAGDSRPKTMHVAVMAQGEGTEVGSQRDGQIDQPVAEPAGDRLDATNIDDLLGAELQGVGNSQVSTPDEPGVVDPRPDENGILADPDQPGEDALDSPEEAYLSLEEAEDQIRSRLARQIVQERMSAALQAVRDVMERYYLDFVTWEAEQELGQGRGRTTRPTPPDLSSLAAEHGLEHGQIPLVDAYQIQEYELGQAYSFRADVGLISFIDLTYTDDFPTFRAHEIDAADSWMQLAGSGFLFWKVDQEAERVPSLEEVRDRVVQAIRLQLGLELAREAASRDAEQLRRSAKSLRDVFGEERVVIDTGEFSWMTFGSVTWNTGRPRLSDIPGVEMPGMEFMRSVFALQPGEVTVAVNQPRNIAYVVYVARQTVDEDQLRREFLEQGLTSPAVQQLAVQEVSQSLFEWYQQLRNRYGVQWVRDPLSGRSA